MIYQSDEYMNCLRDTEHLINNELNTHKSIWYYKEMSISEYSGWISISRVRNARYEDLSPFKDIRIEHLYLPFIYKGIKIIIKN